MSSLQPSRPPNTCVDSRHPDGVHAHPLGLAVGDSTDGADALRAGGTEAINRSLGGSRLSSERLRPTNRDDLLIPAAGIRSGIHSRTALCAIQLFNNTIMPRNPCQDTNRGRSGRPTAGPEHQMYPPDRRPAPSESGKCQANTPGRVLLGGPFCQELLNLSGHPNLRV